MKPCGALGCDVIHNLPAIDHNFVHFYRLYHYKQDSPESRTPGRSVGEKPRRKGKNNKIVSPCSFTRSVEEVDVLIQIISFFIKR